MRRNVYIYFFVVGIYLEILFKLLQNLSVVSKIITQYILLVIMILHQSKQVKSEKFSETHAHVPTFTNDFWQSKFTLCLRSNTCKQQKKRSRLKNSTVLIKWQDALNQISETLSNFSKNLFGRITYNFLKTFTCSN